MIHLYILVIVTTFLRIFWFTWFDFFWKKKSTQWFDSYFSTDSMGCQCHFLFLMLLISLHLSSCLIFMFFLSWAYEYILLKKYKSERCWTIHKTVLFKFTIGCFVILSGIKQRSSSCNRLPNNGNAAQASKEDGKKLQVEQTGAKDPLSIPHCAFITKMVYSAHFTRKPQQVIEKIFKKWSSVTALTAT